jgi:hypothetical protein
MGVTRAHGNISVHGGSQSGNGGFVETSGKHELEVAKTPDITASRGRGGFWLIDPDDLTIVAGNGNVNVNQVGNVFTSSGAGATLGVDLVVTALGGGSTVELRTGASADPLGGTITLSAGVNLDFNGVGNATLSLFADRRIVIDGQIFDSVAGGDSLNLNLTADNDMNGTGNILINNTISPRRRQLRGHPRHRFREHGRDQHRRRRLPRHAREHHGQVHARRQYQHRRRRHHLQLRRGPFR